MLFESITIFIFGLVIGSFLNCVVYRLNEGISFSSGRSFCPNCKHTLAWYDLVPVFSFLFLRGKCRYCGQKISWQYPIVEISTGLVFLLVSITTFDPQLSTLNSLFSMVCLLAVSSLLIIIFIFDLKWYIIPDKVLFAAVGITAAFHLCNFFLGLYSKDQALGFLFSAIGACAFFLAIFLLTRGRAMGFGDVKLAFFMGLFLGWPKIIVALFLAFLIGAIIGLILIALKKKGLRSEIPFGPFLITGLFIALAWGDKLFSSYLNLLY
jgi:prepilin signal peptidase PulO-like enzyme (type II secretory pathway)